MDLDDQFDLEHILLKERKCRVCGEIKDLIDGYYLTRKAEEIFHLPILMSVRYVQLKEL